MPAHRGCVAFETILDIAELSLEPARRGSVGELEQLSASDSALIPWRYVSSMRSGSRVERLTCAVPVAPQQSGHRVELVAETVEHPLRVVIVGGEALEAVLEALSGLAASRSRAAARPALPRLSVVVEAALHPP